METIISIETNDVNTAWETAKTFCDSLIKDASSNANQNGFEDWSTEDCLFKGKLFDSNPSKCYVANTVIVNSNIAACIEKLWGFTLEEQKEFRRSLKSVEILETIDENSKITVQLIEMTFPLWEREAVLFEKKEVSSNEGWIISVSTNHKKAPKNDKKYVRVQMFASAWGFFQENDNVRVWRILHINLNGDDGILPDELVNATSGNSVCESCKWLKSYIERSQHI